MEQNKTSKYFKYAIGEIILVVIGILIALQINNWNEERLQNISETKFLKGLYNEFLLNKDYLINSRKSNIETQKTGRLLMGLINKDIDLIKARNIDSLIFQIFEHGGFEISENTVIEIMQVGQLQKLKNDNLKSLILEWSQKKIIVARNREIMTKKSEYLFKYLIERYPIKNIDMYGPLAWDKPSNIKVDKYAIFYDLKFENILDDYLYNLKTYDDNLEDISKIVEGIIENSMVIND